MWTAHEIQEGSSYLKFDEHPAFKLSKKFPYIIRHLCAFMNFLPKRIKDMTVFATDKQELK